MERDAALLRAKGEKCVVYELELGVHAIQGSSCGGLGGTLRAWHWRCGIPPPSPPLPSPDLYLGRAKEKALSPPPLSFLPGTVPTVPVEIWKYGLVNTQTQKESAPGLPTSSRTVVLSRLERAWLQRVNRFWQTTLIWPIHVTGVNPWA